MQTDRTTFRFSPRLDNVIFAIALAAAAITRLTYLDLAEFKDDESRALGIAAAFLSGKLFPLIGIPSSVGINNPPAFEYLLTLPLLLGRNPAIATGFIGLLGVGAVFFTYRVCDTYFDRTTARVAALLFASAPWAIVFSRKLQAQDVVPFFVILWIGSLFAFASGRGARHLLGVALWLSILLQLHLASVALIPMTGVVVAIAAWRQRGDTRLWRAVAEAVGLTVVLWLPFAIFQLTHKFADLHAFLKVMRQPPTIELESFKLVYEMVYLNAYPGVSGDGYPLYHAQTIDFSSIYDVEGWLFLAGIVWIVARLLISRGRAKTDWCDGILLLWLVIPPLVFLRHSSPIYPHYFLTVFPAQFIVIGRLFTGLAGLVSRRQTLAWAASLVGAGVVGILVVTQVAGLLSVMDFVGRESTLGGHGVPLREREAAIDLAVAAASGSKKPVYVASNGSNYPSAFEYLADPRIQLKVFDDTDTFVVPADDGTPTLYLATDPTQPAAKLLQERFADRQIGIVPWPGMTTGFTLYRLPPDAGAILLHPPSLQPIDGDLPNGLYLAGYQIDRQVKAGGTTQLALYWQVRTNAPEGEGYAFFSHFIDQTGHVWAQQDGLGYPPYFWVPGDSVVSGFDLTVADDLPAGVGQIETGMYRRSDIGRLPITLANGTTTDQLLLGPLRLVPAAVPAVPAPAQPTLVHFGPSIDLIGIDNDWQTNLAAGNRTFQVTLTWKANAVPAADYTTFVHLVDSQGTIVAQSDGQPGPYPTTLWVAGDTIQDVRTLTLAGALPPGTYQLVGGLYRADTLARLESDRGDQVNLGSFATMP